MEGLNGLDTVPDKGLSSELETATDTAMEKLSIESILISIYYPFFGQVRKIKTTTCS
jgi:hypothetical protein